MTEARPRVLVIDDDKTIRELFQALLEDQYDIETCADPLTALDHVRDFRPDVVLLDRSREALDRLGRKAGITERRGRERERHGVSSEGRSLARELALARAAARRAISL